MSTGESRVSAETTADEPRAWTARLRPLRSWSEAAPLLLLVPGCWLAILGYQDHFYVGSQPWWRWVTEVVTAAILVGFALTDPATIPPESSLRRWLRRGLLLLAAGSLAAAISASYTIGAELRTGVLVVLALLLFFAGRCLPLSAVDLAATLDVDSRLPAGLNGVNLGLMGLSIVLGVVTLQVNRWSHVGGFSLWLMSLGLLVLGARRADRSASPLSSENPHAAYEIGTTQQAFLLLFVLLIALLLRFALMGDFPVLIDADEGRQGAWALRMWKEGLTDPLVGGARVPDLFAFGWNSFPNLAYLVESSLIPVFGQSYVSLRMTSAFIGTLSVLLTYLWVGRWWGGVAGLIAAFLLAVNQEHLYWSRVGFNNIHSAAVAALILFTYVRMLQRGRWCDYVMLGFACGLGFYTYHAAKTYSAFLLITSVMLAIGVPGFLRRRLGGVVVAALALILFVLPQSISIYQNWEQFHRDTTNRFDVGDMINAYHQNDFPVVRNYLSSHFLNSFYVFISVPHRLAMFEAWVCVPFLVAVFWLAWRWRDPRNLMLLSWVGGILFLGSMLTSYPPYKPRLIGLLPIACAMPAVLIAEVRRRTIGVWGAKADWVLVPLIATWLVGAAYGNWYTQFMVMAQMQSADSESFITRKVISLPAPSVVYTLGADPVASPAHGLSDALLIPPEGVKLVNLAADADAVPLPPDPAAFAVIFISHLQKEMVSLIRYYYPEAREEIVHNMEGEPLLWTYSLDSTALDRTHSLTPTYRDVNGQISSSPAVTPNSNAAFIAPDELKFPVEATWEGQVWIAEEGEYFFRVNRGTVRVGWEAYVGEKSDSDAQELRIRLRQGWQPLRLAASLHSTADDVSIVWRRTTDEGWQPLPRTQLSRHPQPIGLLGRYFEPGPSGPTDKLAHELIHTALCFDWRLYDDTTPPTWFAPTGSAAEWLGTVELPPNDQPLRLDASAPTQVYINDKLVIDLKTDRDATATTMITGERGRVKLRVKSVRPVGYSEYWRIRLLWGNPGGGWTALAPYQPPL